MASYLLALRGIDKYLAGRLKVVSLISELAKEWASLPTSVGKRHYGGQHAAVTTNRVRGVLAVGRSCHRTGQPVERVTAPVPVASGLSGIIRHPEWGRSIAPHQSDF